MNPETVVWTEPKYMRLVEGATPSVGLVQFASDSLPDEKSALPPASVDLLSGHILKKE